MAANSTPQQLVDINDNKNGKFHTMFFDAVRTVSNFSRTAHIIIFIILFVLFISIAMEVFRRVVVTYLYVELYDTFRQMKDRKENDPHKGYSTDTFTDSAMSKDANKFATGFYFYKKLGGRDKILTDVNNIVTSTDPGKGTARKMEEDFKNYPAVEDTDTNSKIRKGYLTSMDLANMGMIRAYANIYNFSPERIFQKIANILRFSK
jgi:hypothetical protein